VEDLIARLLDIALSLAIMAFAWRLAELRYQYERERVAHYADKLIELISQKAFDDRIENAIKRINLQKKIE